MPPPSPARAVSQYGVPPSFAEAQSLSAWQATQLFVVVSQTDVPAVVQSELLRQPARQLPLAPQIGVDPLQSLFDAHCTH